MGTEKFFLELPVRALTERERFLLDEITRKLGQLLHGPKPSRASREKQLEEIDKYLQRKLRSVTVGRVEDAHQYLRFVRSSLVHGSGVPPEVIDIAIPVLWAVLREGVENWKPTELIHLLAYGLGKGGFFDEDPSGSLIGTINRYERQLNKLPVSERRERFMRLLLSLYAAPAFQKTLKRGRVGLREADSGH